MVRLREMGDFLKVTKQMSNSVRITLMSLDSKSNFFDLPVPSIKVIWRLRQ